MGYLEWNEDLSVENSFIDAHHKKLISLFNRAVELSETNNEASLFTTVHLLSELVEYAIYHFDEEEKLMKAANYPNIEEHIEEHKRYIAKMNELLDNYSTNLPLVNYEIINYLADWIVHHIQVTDAKYKEYL